MSNPAFKNDCEENYKLWYPRMSGLIERMPETFPMIIKEKDEKD